MIIFASATLYLCISNLISLQYFMKTVHFWRLALIPLVILFSCHENKTYKIGVSQCSSDDWREKMNQEILLEEMVHDDVEVEILSAESDSQDQIRDLQYFVDNNFDVIVVSPNEAETLTPVIRDIYKKGIPVIIFDRNINDTTYTQRIGVNNVGLGESAAQYALNVLPKGLKVLEIYGLPGSTPAIDRSAGFHKVLEEEGLEILASGVGNWKQTDARLVTDSLLKFYPETNLIFAHNDRMAIGARKAIESIGRSDIKIIGIDAAPEIGVQAVKDGLIDATFLYPTEGNRILREAINIAKGNPYDKEIILPTTPAVDSSNADILLLQNETIEEDTGKLLALKSQLDNYISLHNAQSALVYAVIAILVLLFGVLFLVLRTFWSHRRHQAALLVKTKLLEEERDKQKELNERLEHATQSKLAFFTNVSHDLRTPLTLISEPVAQLNQAENLDNQQKVLIKLADKNVKILKRLIDQILDFRKFENDRLPLHLEEIDFKQAILDWIDSFSSVARKHDIKIELVAPDYDVNLALDAEKIERVVFNLISNALKYSPANSRIRVEYSLEGDKLRFTVEDEGVGISSTDIGHIFDPFFQVDKIRPKGSGIGLSLAKAFVELHGGEIRVESELHKGTVFTIVLPVRHVDEKTSVVVKQISSNDVEIELTPIETEVSFEGNKPLLLVIDDNKDIRDMVSELMKDEYNILTAAGGKEGIHKATKYVPDLIICDVMMPGMDGMECCALLKGETITSHIPVLMLTACSLDEQRVEGLDSGADAYLAKPFSTSVLKAQSASLIANRKRIKNVLEMSGAKLIKPKSAVKPGTVTNTDIDNDFYNRFLILFEEKMGDPDLNVEAMASELGFERTQLYRKIKAITNYSPVELMRNLRLKKARTLLKTTDKTVSEICYEVGFSNPAYFSKCYREQFGETPSETRA